MTTGRGDGGARGTTRAGWWRCTVFLLSAVVVQGATALPSQAQAAQGDGGTAPPRRALTLTAARVSGGMSVDGVLDEAAWAAADAARDFVQLMPTEGAPATEPTEVRLLLDDDALYVGAVLRDHDPDGIVARLGRRDDDVQADWFYVFLDGYQDRRSAYGFGVSAAGVQRDLRVSDDVMRDASWDAVWDSEARRSPDGWVVEMRIPLSQLRFERDGRGRWGVNFARTVARKNERSHWAPMSQGTQSFVSRFGDLDGMGDLTPKRRVEVVPYTVARMTRAPVAAGHPFRSPVEQTGSVGADVRVGLGSSLTLSATINPDFGQVEGDPAVLNLTAFETFQEERRPFFVEGADIFRLAHPGWPPMFYSRRIGRAPQLPGPAGATATDRPASTTILGALKLTGKTESGWSVGIMDAVTPTETTRYVDGQGVEGRATAEPRTHYGVVRVAREFRGGRSGLGLLATTVNRTLDQDPALSILHEDAYGLALDAYHRFAGGRWEARVGVQGSQVRGDTAAIRRTQTAPGHYFQRPDADHVTLDLRRTALSGYLAGLNVRKLEGPWRTGLFAQVASPGFEVSDLGFNPSLDQGRANTFLRYDQYTPGPLLRSWGMGTSMGIQSDLGGRLQEFTQDAGFNVQFLNYWGVSGFAMRHAPAWTSTALRGGPALRKPGRWMGSMNVYSDGRRSVVGRANLFWELEDETEGSRLNLNATLTARPSHRLDVTVGPSVSLGREDWQFVGTRDTGGSLRHVVGGLDQRTLSLTTRVDYTLSPTLSLQLYARPFVATVRYDVFREVADPASSSFEDRFTDLGVTRTDREGADLLAVDRDGDGATDFEMADPSFSTAAVQMNTVLRWEYRPGSTLFAVWTHDRDTFGRDRFAVGDNLDGLWRAPSRNVFMLKASYWIGR